MSNHVQKLIRILIIPSYAALVFALKEVLAILPNIEVVTFLLAFSALVFPLYMSITIPLIFASLEILLYGGNSWIFLYFSIWPILVIIIWIFRHLIKKHWWIFVIITSLWGFTFGTFDALIHLILFGKSSFYLYWLSGLSFDAIHGIGNFMFSSFLYKPIISIWNKYLQYYIIIDNNIIEESNDEQTSNNELLVEQ
ncbi:MAG: hypothetical protein PPFGHCPK_00611 [Spiroplasma endosymbiont of Drosophila atripex]|nr:MAG: hypothetical protein PPFGHCPK_00611 [Spiroplasma endosymbiont of Drosophila atripex]